MDFDLVVFVGNFRRARTILITLRLVAFNMRTRIVQMRSGCVFRTGNGGEELAVGDGCTFTKEKWVSTEMV